MRVVGHPVAADLGVDARLARTCVLEFLADEHGCPLAHDETVAFGVKRPTGVAGVGVGCRHGLDQRERAECQRRERRFDAAGQHQRGVPVTYHAERLTDRDRARSARVAVGQTRAVRTELDGDVARARAAEDG